ncbi:uncharacterized protein [Arachis hypogaea]|uniref:uncharacterized protein n=1 Tax=Arachis hypogaea TaxID=3818 RepID=UPI000DEC1FFB|nr:uncharacterized protein LOC112703183 isoform X1 [Arachis hypogaea]QHO28497.1 uncharacterized protein DS421_7g217220 [Arachis hypogaea]
MIHRKIHKWGKVVAGKGNIHYFKVIQGQFMQPLGEFILSSSADSTIIAFMYSSKHTHSRYWFLATGDWCLLPSSAYSSPISMEKGMSKLELHGSIYNELNSNPTGSGCDSEEAVVEESNGNKDAMDLEIRSKENVVGKLVRTKHHKEITFPLVINSSESKPIRFKKNLCTYG